MGAVESQISLPIDGMHRTLADAAGVCLARWGVTKTTVSDIATEAGCSRATVYRFYPGGKNQIMAVYGRSELLAFFGTAAELVASADTIEDALVDVITTAADDLAGHDGFQFMLAHEPGLVLPYLGFTNIDRLYRLATEVLAPAFARLSPEHATTLVELATRITLSHTFQPSDSLDLRDPDGVRRLVRCHLVPICTTSGRPTPASGDATVAPNDLAPSVPVSLAVPA